VRVTFYLPGEPDLERLLRLDLEADWLELVRGEHAWTLQTYLRLRRAGYPVEISGDPIPGGILVFHAKHEDALLRNARGLGATVLVGIRADNREPPSADFQVVQNHVFAHPHERFYVPLWPQPGLLPRDPGRAARIERVAFKGFEGNLDGDFLRPRFRDLLAARGIEWSYDAVDFRDAGRHAALDWHDFRSVDLVLAVRPSSVAGHASKPATKLTNAWLAGVPALLGPEPAYRELRRSDLDYVEVRSHDEAIRAVDRLLESPDLYRAMVERGRERAPAFTAGAIVPLWAELLFERIPALANERSLRSVPLRARALLRRVGRVLEGRPAR
jgi:hypothetical protein